MSLDTEQQVDPDDGEDEPVVDAPPRHFGTGKGGVAPGVFYPGIIIVGVVVVLAISFPGTVNDVFGSALEGVVSSIGWAYTLVVAAFVIYSLWLGISRIGDMQLGIDDDEPQLSLMEIGRAHD